MSKYEKIMQRMTIEQMAEIRTHYQGQSEDLGELEWYLHINDAGKFEDKDDAIKAEIEWLKGGE